MLLALIIIGPKDLPRVARTIGQWVRKGRMLAREFQTSLEDMAKEAELDDVKKEIEKVGQTDFKKAVENSIDPKGELKQAFDTSNGASGEDTRRQGLERQHGGQGRRRRKAAGACENARGKPKRRRKRRPRRRLRKNLRRRRRQRGKSRRPPPRSRQHRPEKPQPPRRQRRKSRQPRKNAPPSPPHPRNPALPTRLRAMMAAVLPMAAKSS